MSRLPAFRPCGAVTLALVAAVAVASCNPMRSAAFVVAPQPSASVDRAASTTATSPIAAPAAARDSSPQAVFASVAHIAASHGLTPLDPRDSHGNNVDGWRECYGRGSLVLCGKVIGGEAHFRMWQMGHFSADADGLRRDLTRSLEEQFGEGSVHDCEWQRAPDPHRSGCSTYLHPDDSGGEG